MRVLVFDNAVLLIRVQSSDNCSAFARFPFFPQMKTTKHQPPRLIAPPKIDRDEEESPRGESAAGVITGFRPLSGMK
jgi:hypothetical protein